MKKALLEADVLSFENALAGIAVVESAKGSKKMRNSR